MNNGEIKIEHDVPVPAYKGKSAIGIAVRQMKIGDSIVVTVRQRNTAFSLVRTFNEPWKLVSRSERNSDLIRIWRIQ